MRQGIGGAQLLPAGHGESTDGGPERGLAAWAGRKGR